MKKLVIPFAFLLLLIASTFVSAESRVMLLDVQETQLAWGDSRIADKLQITLSRDPLLSVQCPQLAGSDTLRPDDRTSVDALINWGTEMGGRYLLVVTVDDEGLKRRKGFNLPIIFHKYETVGYVKGEFRFVDLARGRLVAAEPFEIEMEAARQFQLESHTNRNDPDLHLTAPEKIAFFGRLEDRLVEHIVKRIGRLTRGR